MKKHPKSNLFFEHADHDAVVDCTKSCILADSAEVRYGHYAGKIRQLETQLAKLTLLEHPCEIQVLCSQIIQIKKKLAAPGFWCHN